ncbi:unnamed protein product [Tuber melanosporum]|uniref:(Perigord truffle) hypothetical protein n=1 Tax=Tuber melanosporum (strain Mel28) TaxID=656061 RepID=D5GMV7_TUBMM|nr:uncharacterized protein GSTUM_00010957001 [Tuber melanosporum]CAZ85850.1 unnamed protein product [Tuber melanosporum]
MKAVRGERLTTCMGQVLVLVGETCARQACMRLVHDIIPVLEYGTLLRCDHKNRGCDRSDLLLYRKDDCRNWKIGNLDDKNNRSFRQLRYRSLLHL